MATTLEKFLFFSQPERRRRGDLLWYLEQTLPPNQEIQNHSSQCHWCCSEKKDPVLPLDPPSSPIPKAPKCSHIYLTAAVHKGEKSDWFVVNIVGGGEMWVRQTYCRF